MPFNIRNLIVIGCIFALANCGGGGGGGGGFIGAAQVSLSASPTTIDSGDRMLVRAQISRVHENGILLKFRYPDALTYVLDSAILTVNGKEIDASPSTNAAKDGDIYLVYFFSQGIFDEDFQGEFSMQLEGTSALNSGTLEVDSDVDDPLIDDSVEFDIENPEFVPEDSVSVRVMD